VWCSVLQCNIKSGPEVPSRISSCHMVRLPVTFVGTDLVAFLRFGRVWFTKPVVYCAAKGEMAGRTAHDECRQQISHVVSARIAQALVLKLGENLF